MRPNSPAVINCRQLDDRRMIEEDMSDHQDAPGVLLGQLDQSESFGGGQRQGLFDEDVFAGQEALSNHGIVGRGGRGHGDEPADLRIVQHVLDTVGERRRSRGEGNLSETLDVGIADDFQRAEFREDADEVLPPVAASE